MNNCDSQYYSDNMTDPNTDLPLDQKITLGGMEGFWCRIHILNRAATSKHKVTPANEEEEDVIVAAHL